MLIACLGWGSLVWDPGALPVRAKWFEDGPFLPIEFARQSRDGRLTLVLVAAQDTRVRSLWALFSVRTLDEARKSLGEREGGPAENPAKHIAAWSGKDSEDPIHAEIGSWASTLRLSAVVWTALPPRYKKQDRCPTEDEAVKYLRHLPHESRRLAERYIRMTPRQVDTPYRRRFEVEFGWTPSGEV